MFRLFKFQITEDFTGTGLLDFSVISIGIVLSLYINSHFIEPSAQAGEDSKIKIESSSYKNIFSSVSSISFSTRFEPEPNITSSLFSSLVIINLFFLRFIVYLDLIESKIAGDAFKTTILKI